MSAHPFFRRFVASFLVALMLLVAALAAFLLRTREMGVFLPKNIETEAAILWGPGFGQQSATYKLRRTLWKRPDLLVLGSSRVTQIRAEMAPGIRSYNAALAASSLPEALAFLRALYPQHRPQVVVLGIDPWWFDPHQGRSPALTPAIFDIRGWLANAVQRGLFSPAMMSRALRGVPEGPDRFGGRQPVGYLAASTSSGFRPDGSYQYGDVLLGLNPQIATLGMAHAQDFAFYTRAVRHREDRFRYVGPLAERQLSVLRAILRLNAEAGVRTVILLPSFPAAVWRSIQETPAQRDYFARITATVTAVAAERGVQVFDYQDLSDLEVSDVQTIDGIHADEVATAIMWRDLVHRSAVLAAQYGTAGAAALDRLVDTAAARPWPHMLIR